MTFLKNVHVSRMLIRDGDKLFPLAPYQLQQIILFQSNKPYDSNWLFPLKHKPFFLHHNLKKFICFFPSGESAPHADD